MIPVNSKKVKIVIFTLPVDESTDLVSEAVILLMEGIHVLKVFILGNSIDDNSDNREEYIEGIIDEETSSTFLDKETVKFQVITVEGDSFIFTQTIYDIIETLVNSVEEYDYIVYNELSVNDNQPILASKEFYLSLEEYIHEKDDDLIPIHFKDIYQSDASMNFLLEKNGITNHTYIRESCISNAIYTGVLFDIGIGE